MLERVVALAEAAEGAGFDSFWVSDQEAPEARAGTGPPRLEAYSLLGAIAVRTNRLRLGVVPLEGERRPPSMVAKIVTGIDVISHGRGILTVGRHDEADDQDEAQADALRVGRAMLHDEVPSVIGSVYSIREAFNRPRPVQVGGVPVVALLGADRSALRDTSAAIASLADALLVVGGGDEARAVCAQVRPAPLRGTGGTGSGGFGTQVIAMASDRRGSARDGMEDSVRGLFDAGVDGCLIPVGMDTSPGRISDLAEAVQEWRVAP